MPGASPLERPFAVPTPPSSTMTSMRLPTLAASFLALIALLPLHEALPAALLDLVGHGLEAEIVGAGARDRLVFEGADAIELGLVEPVEQHAEILLGLAGKADDEGRADRRDPGRSRARRECARASSPDCRAGACPSAPWARRAGTARRYRAARCRRSSARRPRRHADRDRRNAGAPRRPMRPSSRVRSRKRAATSRSRHRLAA